MALTKLNFGGNQTALVSSNILPAIPSGSVIQTVSSSYQTRRNISTGGSFTEVDGFTASITPTSTSSKILITCNLSVGSLTNNYTVAIRLYVNGSHLSDASADDAIGGTNDIGNWCYAGYQDYSNYARHFVSPQYLHSPNSTSSQQYSIYVNNPHQNGPVTINRHSYVINSDNLCTTKSNWILQEIKG